jgi:hypothetical protein
MSIVARKKLIGAENRARLSIEESRTTAGMSDLRKPVRKVGPKDRELQAVKEVVVSFLTAMKSYALYPESHAMCRNAVSNVSRQLEGFLKDRESLRFDVDRDGLFFDNQMVYEKPPGTESLPFLLYRDGIQWLEFHKGIGSTEILAFLMILKKYRDVQGEAEGDLVTALWELDLPNLRYESADIFWESELVQDLSTLDAGEVEEDRINQSQEEPDPIANQTAEPANPGMWRLNPEEVSELGRMALEEESRDPAEDVLDIVLLVLDDQQEAKDLSQVLGFLEDELHDTLQQGEFQFAFKFLSGLRRLRHAYETEKPWAILLIDEFFKKISSDQILGVLKGVLPTLDTTNPDVVKSLGQFLLLLPSDAIFTLGPMLSQVRSPQVELKIMKTIGMMAKRDLRPLESLLKSPDEFMVQKLVYVLGRLKGERPTQILLQMLDHPTDRVRKQALKLLLARDEELIETLFPLVEDPNDAIRWVMLTHLGNRRSPLAESLFVGYLGQRVFKVRSAEHILACYKALGRCGSSRCIPFLSKVLLKGCWIPKRQKAVHRRGAAIALNELETQKAKDVLQRASRSLFPTVRLAYRSINGG